MSQLVLISGFKNESALLVKLKLSDLLKSHLPDFNDLWMDPSKKPRAVVLLDKNLELKDIQKHFEKIDVKEAKPTNSVFVKTNESITFGVKDKLKYLFTSRKLGGSQVLKVEQLKSEGSDCFEIFFLNWDAVLNACKQTWTVKNKKLSVTPYFECFKEPFEANLQKSLAINNVTKNKPTVKSVDVSDKVSNSFSNVHTSKLEQLTQQPTFVENKNIQRKGDTLTTSFAQNETHNLKSTSSEVKLQNLIDKPAISHQDSALSLNKNDSIPSHADFDENKSGLERLLILKHPCISMLLHLLNFEKAAEVFTSGTTTVNVIKKKINESQLWQIKITGAANYVEIIENILAEEDKDLPEIVTDCLAIDTVKHDLKDLIATEKLNVSIAEVQGSSCLQVCYGDGRVILFHHFLTSLVNIKECCQLSNEQLLKHTKWIDFIKIFKRFYPKQLIIVKGQHVFLANLSHAPEDDLDFFVNKFNKAIKELNPEETDLKHVHSNDKLSDNLDLASQEIINPNAEHTVHLDTDSQEIITPNAEHSVYLDTASQEIINSKNTKDIYESLESMQTKPVSKTKKIKIVFQSATLVWIFKVLNFTKAVQKVYSDLSLDINENDKEIIVRGSPNEIEKIGSVLKKENVQFDISEKKQLLLSDRRVQEHLMNCFKRSCCHLALHENLKLYVVYNNDEKTKFSTVLRSFFKTKRCSKLPEKYHSTKEWTSYTTSIKDREPCLCVVTLNEDVYLIATVLGDELPNINYYVNKINEKVSALESTSGEMARSSSTGKNGAQNDHTMVKDAFKNYKDQSGGLPSPAQDKISKQKITCKMPGLPKILDVLKLKEAVQDIGISVNFDDENVTIRNPGAIDLQKAIINLDNKMHYENPYEEIFTNKEVVQFVCSNLQDLGAHISLSDNLNFYIELRSKEKIPFKDIFTKVIQIKKCSKQNMHNHTEEYAKSIQGEHYYIQVTESDLFLLTLSGESYSEVPIVHNLIRGLLSSSSSVDHDSEMSDDNDAYTLIYKCETLKKEYCMKFLQQDIENISSHYKKNYKAVIDFYEHGFKIMSSSAFKNNKMEYDLSQILEKIKVNCHISYFPQLQSYLKEEGSEVIKRLSNEHKCYIKTSDFSGKDYQSILTGEQTLSTNTAGLDYKVMLLGTAKCHGLNVHLVHGQAKDLNLEMKIELAPSQEGNECETKSVKSSINLVIKLPPWLAKNYESDYLDNLRNSLFSAVSDVLKQAKYLKKTLIAFSINHKNDSTQHPFPPSVIAKTIVENLFEHLYSKPNAENVKTYDVYICSEKHEAVFKAFSLFLKLKNAHINRPNQDSWDHVSFEESGNYTDYTSLHSKGISFDISSTYEHHCVKNACIFYPINPNMDFNTCAALKDPYFSEYELKSCFPDPKKYPNGILAGKILPLTDFKSNSKAFIYGCPEWDMYFKQNIQRVMNECIKFASNYEKVYFIPPGILQQSGHSETYLAHILFKELDKVIMNLQYNSLKKKITLIVQEPAYKKTFDQELQKRSFKKYQNDISSQHKTSQKEAEKVKTNTVSGTTIHFVTQNLKDSQNAIQNLEKHLKGLMKSNEKTLDVDKKKADEIKKMMKDNEINTVKISFAELDSKEKEKKSKFMKHTQNISFWFKIEGLRRSSVDEFLEMLNLKEKDENKCLQAKSKTPSDRNTYSASNTRISTTIKESNKSVPGDKPTQSPATSSHFEWLYASKTVSHFDRIDKNLKSELEMTYSIGHNSLKLEGKFKEVDFISMTAIKDKEKVNLIRSEVFDKEWDKVNDPVKWVPISKKSKNQLIQLQEEMEEFKDLEKGLEKFMKKHDLCLKEVHRIQNKKLYNRFCQKSSKLEDKNIKTMWHKAKKDCQELICKNGFHQNFSGMPEARHLGDGVLFCEEPDQCFDTYDEIILFSAIMLLGKSGPGKQGLRNPPKDEKTDELLHSVYDDKLKAYMIFSDTQAYPDYMLILKEK